jgi:hypothetical protein
LGCVIWFSDAAEDRRVKLQSSQGMKIEKKIFFSITFLFLYPVLGIITDFYFPNIYWSDQNWLNDLTFKIYEHSIIWGFLTLSVQLIFYAYILVWSITHRMKKYIIWSSSFLLITLFLVLLNWIRVIAAASGV